MFVVDTDKIKWLLRFYSQTDIAKGTGISQQTISRIANNHQYIGKLSIDNGIKLTELASEFREMIGLDRRW